MKVYIFKRKTDQEDKNKPNKNKEQQNKTNKFTEKKKKTLMRNLLTCSGKLNMIRNIMHQKNQ